LPLLGRSPAGAKTAPGLTFGNEFWSRWGDDRAEISVYDLRFPRYGETRDGIAVAIFVTETFSEDDRVKVEPGTRPSPGDFPVMKLNLVQDFPTGIYDYNLMTSTFVGLTPAGGRPAGSVAKVAFSSQEWCGQVFQEILPRGDRVESTSHNYSSGKANENQSLDRPEDGFFEDALYLWARGYSRPGLAPGESRRVSLLVSSERIRLLHLPLEWRPATLRRAATPTEVSVPAGVFETEELTASVENGPTWRFFVETAWPRRIIRWEASDGRSADLVRSERLKYWEMNSGRFLEELDRIGLSSRPPRTP
jgi:hypothetical protein